MRLNHNMASLSVFREYSNTLIKQSDAMNKLSSGYRINKASDNPVKLAQSERVRMQIRGTQMAMRNIQDGVSVIQTAEGGLEEITNCLQRIRELTVQSGSPANSPEDLNVIQKEIDQMIEGIRDNVKNTEFNGKKLLDKEYSLELSAGANAGDTIDFKTYDLNPQKMPKQKNSDDFVIVDLKKGGKLSVDKGNIADGLELIDKSLDFVTYLRDKYGTLENRFEESLESFKEMDIRMEESDSNLRDSDIAEQMMEVARCNILVESSNAIIAQTNKLPQEVLKILENVRPR